MHLEMHLFFCYNIIRGDRMNSAGQEYTVIIGDIVNSREINDRREIQTRFRAVLSDINSKYKAYISARFKITLGDEFQGLLSDCRNVIRIIMEIENLMRPLRLRFGVGIGTIDTDIIYDDSSEIDGPAYHRARGMIEQIGQKEMQYEESQSNIMICSGDSCSDQDMLINSLLSATFAIKSKWTGRQDEIIRVYETNGENQYKTAEILGIAQSTVNRALRNARFYAYKSAIDTISKVLTKEE